MRKTTKKNVEEYLQQTKKGWLLSEEVPNGKTVVTFKCKNPNHPPFNKKVQEVVSADRWCPQCGKIERNKHSYYAKSSENTKFRNRKNLSERSNKCPDVVGFLADGVEVNLREKMRHPKAFIVT